MQRNRFKKLWRFQNSRGDLIVEVLIAMLILGIMLAGGYALSRNSLFTSVNADTRSQAQSLAQSQIEQMIATQKNSPSELSHYTIERPYCIMPDGQISDANTSAQVCPDYNNNKAKIAVGVVYDKNSKTFTVKGKWNISRGDPLNDPDSLAYSDQVTLYYRLPVDFPLNSLALNVYIRGTGQGTVRGGGINCGNTGLGSANCFKTYTATQFETLRASAEPGSKFVKWDDDCGGIVSTCTLFINQIMFATATFEKQGSSCQPTLQPVNEDPDGFVPPSVFVHINLKTGCQLTKCYVEFGQARGIMNWGTSICGLSSSGVGYDNSWESAAWANGQYHAIATSIGRSHSTGSGHLLENSQKVYYRYCADNGGGNVCEPSYRCAQMDSVPNDGKHDGRPC
jgi:Tfp pilus assembly protein PilV